MKNDLTALIIDDESLARYMLRNKLAQYPEIEILGEAGNIKDAITAIRNLNPQLLFLDVQLTDGTGFDLINKIEYKGRIIFISAYDEYALRAFEINALDYLMKPVSDKRLKTAIEKLFQNNTTNNPEVTNKLNINDRLMFSYRKSVCFIELRKIILIVASREYCYVHTIDGKEILSNKRISDWVNILPDFNFCRIHRSYIISFDSILSIIPDITGTAEIRLQGYSDTLKVSRSYFKKLKERYSV